MWIREPIPDTRIGNPAGNRFVLVQALAYGPPEAGVSLAEDLQASFAAPLRIGDGGALPCVDGDADGFVDCSGACEPPAGTLCGECDDTDPSVHPDAAEVCNGVDDDCDVRIDEDLPSTTWWRDGDNDGYGGTTESRVTCDGAPGAGWIDNAADCDDGNASIRPGAAEACNGIDDDCDVSVDEGLPTTTWGRDVDGDGYGDSSSAVSTCDGAPGTGWVEDATDCQDADPSVWPGAPEWCDGSDRDCSGTIDDPPCADFDLDGNGRVDGIELARIGRAFGSCTGEPSLPPLPVDLNRDGCVDGNDLSLLGNVWATTCATDVLQCL
jgi:hypothetical protein